MIEATARGGEGATQGQRRFRGPRALLTSSLFAVVMSLILATGAFAATGQWYDVPNKNSADADAIIDRVSFGTLRSTAYGSVEIDPSGGNCVYVQAQFTATAALDGGWFRLSPASGSYCANPRLTYNWSRSFTLAYNGMKFKLCKPINNGPDQCGSASANIRF